MTTTAAAMAGSSFVDGDGQLVIDGLVVCAYCLEEPEFCDAEDRRGRMRTVGRYETPDGMSEPENELRDYAVKGLFRLAATGSTGDGFWDLHPDATVGGWL